MILLSKQKVKTLIKSNEGKSYTYALCRQDGTPYYIGVGTNSRIFRHGDNHDLNNCNNKLKINEINKYGISYAILCFNNRNYCAEMEKNAISYFGRRDIASGILSNLTDGGEHAPYGYVPPTELRQRKSKKAKENSDLYSDIAKQQWKNMGEEEKENRRQDKANMMLSRWANSEYRELKRQEAIDRWSNPDFKAAVSLKIKESQPVEHLRNIMKNKWADPEFREMMIESRRIARLKKKGEPVPITQDILQNET